MVEAAREYQGRRRALVVSISQYDNLAALDFCERDGNKICEVLTQLGYDIPIKYRLIGGRIEYDKLRDSILDFFYDKTIDPKDTVLFYFSGHGVLGDDGEHYLATSGIDPDNPYKRGFPFDGLTKARGECNSKMVFTVLDCCYSGADKLGKGSAKGSSKAQEESASVAKDTIKEKSSIPGEGKCVLAACKPMQRAFEYKEKGHSFFSYYLSEALTSQECVDKDGDVTPYALNTYIDNKIRSLPAEIRPKQTPFLNCSTAGKIALAHHAIPATEWKGSKSDYLLNLLLEEKIEEFNKVRKEGDIPLYLRKIDLRLKNLSGVDLHEADLSEAKLVGTKLIAANLNGAKLKGADLGDADLRTANLYGANLSMANLNRADLRGADLKGMINFSGANLTGADVRGVDLSGMVNFSGAKLHDVNFTGSITEKGLINFDGADIYNAKGLPVLHEPNEYLEALKSFSESIKEQFKTHNIPAEQAKPIEEGVNELVKEVEDIQAPEEIDDIKKKNINSKFVEMVQRVIIDLPATKTTEEIQDVFRPMVPFARIIGDEVPQLIKSIQRGINTGGTSTHVEDYAVTSGQQLKPIGGAISSSPSFTQTPISNKKDITTTQSIKKPTFEAPPEEFKPTGSALSSSSPFYQYRTSTEDENVAKRKENENIDTIAEKTIFRPTSSYQHSTPTEKERVTKKPLNKWIIILPIILVGVIGIVIVVNPARPSSPVIAVGSVPSSIALNPNTNIIYVANHGDNTISVIDGKTNKVTDALDTGNSPSTPPVSIAVNPNTNRIYAITLTPTGQDNPLWSWGSTLLTIDGTNNTILSRMYTNGSSIAVNPNTNMAYVTDGATVISAINITTNKVVRSQANPETNTIPPFISDNIIAVNQNTNMVYVADYNDNRMSVIDGRNNSLVKTIPIGKAPIGVAVNQNTNMIYIISNDTAYIIDGRTNTLIANVYVGSALSSIAVNPTTNKVYITNSHSSITAIIDGTTNKIIQNIPVGNSPSDIAVNPNTNIAYVINRNDNTVSVVSQFY